MVNIIIKPLIQDDFYLIYSTTSDMPKHWGARADLMQRFRWATEEAMTRADLFGTSDLYNLDRRGWAGGPLWIGNGLDSPEPFVAREELRQLCESWDRTTRSFKHPSGVATHTQTSAP